MTFSEEAKKAQEIKKSFKEGMKVECIHMDDIHAVPTGTKTGTKGVIEKVDDLGTIHVKWENGSSLGLIVGEDLFKVI